MINRTVSQSGTGEKTHQHTVLRKSFQALRDLECRNLKLTVHDEFDFAIRVPCRVPGGIDVAEIHAVIPPHHLSDDQVGFCRQITSHYFKIRQEHAV